MYLCMVMNEVLISIGSNENKDRNLAICHQLLDANFNSITYSDIQVTNPYGSNYKNDFINQLAIINTNIDRVTLIEILKSIERKLGRKSEDKKDGIVKIDIDVIIWNNEIIKPEDITRSYIKDLLPSLPVKDYTRYIIS